MSTNKSRDALKCNIKVFPSTYRWEKVKDDNKRIKAPIGALCLAKGNIKITYECITSFRNTLIISYFEVNVKPYSYGMGQKVHPDVTSGCFIYRNFFRKMC